MKVLVIGDSSFGGTARTFESVFTGLSIECVVLDDWQLYRASSPLARNRYIHHLFWRSLAYCTQRKLLHAVIQERPNLILVLKGFLFHPNTLRKIRADIPGVVLFNYNGDNPFNTWHHGNSSSWVRRSIPLYDAYFIWGEFLRQPLLEAGAQRFEYLPCAYDPGLHYPIQPNEEEKTVLASDVAFTGSWDEERDEWLRTIADYDLKIWGNSWEKASKVVRVKWQGREMVGENFSKVCAAAKIQLNFIRRQNGTAHNMRTYEIPACGGFLLTTRTPEQEALFAEGKEAAFFSTPRELREKLDYYLSHDEERIAIAAAGRRKIIEGKNTYRDRAERILEIYQEIKRLNT